MVGRGWWLLVLKVCVTWMVCFVCGGLSCQKGQEFYNSQDGQCVPCTRCQHPLVVVVPCYVYRDAVCAPAINFLPNLSQHHGPEAPITLSTPTYGQNDSSGLHISTFTKNKPYISSEFKKTHDYEWGKDRLLFSRTFRNSSNGSLPNSENNHRKYKKSHIKHRHRHKQIGSHASHNIKSLPVTELDPEMKRYSVSSDSGANKSVLGFSDFGDSRLSGVNISDGANSNKDLNSNLKETRISQWQNIYFLMTVIVISVCVIILVCIILSQLRNIFLRRKLKQRRVMGPSTSVDTNLYIESWQQADSQAPNQHTLSVSSVLATHTLPPTESVSACPSPVPLRTYRLGPASASASPIIAVRGVGSRMALRGLLPAPVGSPCRSRELVLNSRT